MKKIAVVGGGITGLTAAFRLKQAGLNCLVYEAGASAGGVIKTEEEGGFLFETGPNSLQESPEEVTELIQALSLEGEVVEANPAAKNRYILRQGKPVPLPMSPPALLRTPLLSWTAKLRLLKEPFVTSGRGRSDESVADFVRRRLGPEVLDYFVNPFIAGIFAGDPENLSVRYALPRLFALEDEHGSLFRGMKAAARRKREGKGSLQPRLISFRHGLGTMARELEKNLRENIYLEATVESITERDGRWELIASRYGRRLRDTYDVIILALPAKALAQLRCEKDHEDFSPRILREIPHPPVASVSFGFKREQVNHPLDGFGMLIPEKERRQILGTLFPSTLFPGRAPEGHVLLTSFVGGSRQPDLARASADSLLRMVLEDLRPLLGISGEPCFSHNHLWPEAIPQYEVGHGRFLEAIEDFETGNPGLFLAGTCRDGISVGQCIASGFRHADRARKFLAGVQGIGGVRH
jgi:protoporphyrinogen/coproporphyrinogen III oxidase